MGLCCAKEAKNVKIKRKTSEQKRTSKNSNKSSEKCKKVYLCDEEGHVVSSHQMRGLPDNIPDISPDNIDIITTTWAVIKKDIEHVGVVTFIGLLEDSLEVKNLFEDYRELNEAELRESTELRSHVFKVFGAVDKVVTRLSEPEHLIDFLHDLGQKHMRYSTKPEFLDLIGPQFINAIQPVLEGQWTPKAEQAWADLFRFMTQIMKDTMLM